MSTPALITPPTQAVVTLDEVKAQLRITSDDKDDMIATMVAAAVNELDPAGGGYLGRALRPQTWEFRLHSFYARGNGRLAIPSPCGAAIELPIPPLIEIISVKYDDVDGVERTLTENTDFKVFGAGGLGKQSIAPLYGKVWPYARFFPESVRIRFTAGYDKADNPDPLPGAIKQAVHLAVRNIYSLGEQNLFQSLSSVVGVSETRWIVSPAGSELIRTAVENMVSTYRVW